MRSISGRAAAASVVLLAAWAQGCFLNGTAFDAGGTGGTGTTTSSTTAGGQGTTSSAGGGVTSTSAGPGGGGESTGGGGAGGSGGSGGQGGSVGGMGGMGGMGGVATTSSTSTGGPVCGDGVTEGPEACDDMNEVQGDGCDHCELDCGCAGCVEGEACGNCPAAGQTLFKDIPSGHCYVYVSAAMNWGDARTTCQGLGNGWDLFSPSTTGEMGMLWNVPGMPIDNHLSANGRNWTGGTDQFNQGTFSWVNGEQWNSDQQGGLVVESVSGGEDCLVIGGLNPNVTLRGNGCSIGHPFVCEDAP
jgi:cysteine-rich repeat protein